MSPIYPNPRMVSPPQTGPGTKRDRPDSHGDLVTAGACGMTRSAAVVIAVTLQRLVDDASREWSFEEELVLVALRRSSSRLTDASVRELSDYVAAMDTDQLRGLAANVKGIYHELLFVQAQSGGDHGAEVRLFEAPNHPGADVEFLVDGETIREVQLKAVATPHTVLAHLERYPDIEVLVTEEVASRLDGVEGSGFFNVALSGRVDEVFGDLPTDDLHREILDGAATSALVAGALTASQVLRTGRLDGRHALRVAGDVTLGAIAAAALDAMLDTMT